MAFVKLDCGILDSTLWFERDAREVFITALLMAEPFELLEPALQLEATSLRETGFIVPPGWYGFVHAAGVGIIHRAKVDEASGLKALELLGNPETSSRSRAFDGRRLVRIDGGFLVLNYMIYRERDYTAAERARRYRERRAASRRDVTASHRDITQAEAEAEAEADQDQNTLARSRSPKQAENGFAEFWSLYPKRKGKGAALKAWTKHAPPLEAVRNALVWQVGQPDWTKDGGQFIPHPATWLNQRRWEDEPFHAPAPRAMASTFAWRDECQALHGGRCGSREFHAAVMAKDE